MWRRLRLPLRLLERLACATLDKVHEPVEVRHLERREEGLDDVVPEAALLAPSDVDGVGTLLLLRNEEAALDVSASIAAPRAVARVCLQVRNGEAAPAPPLAAAAVAERLVLENVTNGNNSTTAATASAAAAAASSPANDANFSTGVATARVCVVGVAAIAAIAATVAAAVAAAVAAVAAAVCPSASAGASAGAGTGAGRSCTQLARSDGVRDSAQSLQKARAHLARVLAAHDSPLPAANARAGAHEGGAGRARSRDAAGVKGREALAVLALQADASLAAEGARKVRAFAAQLVEARDNAEFEVHAQLGQPVAACDVHVATFGRRQQRTASAQAYAASRRRRAAGGGAVCGSHTAGNGNGRGQPHRVGGGREGGGGGRRRRRG